jgi:hypothetical protein
MYGYDDGYGYDPRYAPAPGWPRPAERPRLGPGDVHDAALARILARSGPGWEGMLQAMAAMAALRDRGWDDEAALRAHPFAEALLAHWPPRPGG